jgi:alkylation response protein AidB-like acyl-CoA dehydrogenase
MDSSDDFFADVLQLRLTGSELALKASQSAMLHSGARGYLANAPAQRKLRESYFVAIVTPAIKHLRKELARLHSH